MTTTVKLVLLAIIAAALAGAVFAVHQAGYSSGYNARKVENADTDALVRDTVQKASAAAVAAVNSIRITNTVINRRIENATRTNTVYVDCRHSDGVLDDLNSALSGRRGTDAAAKVGVHPASAPGR